MELVTLPIVCSASAWVTMALVVPRLPEPPPDEVDDPAAPGTQAGPQYATLATPALQVAAAALGAGSGLLAASQPLPLAGMLAVLGGPTAALVLVDLRTTWLPRTLSHACAALMLAGGAAAVAASSLGTGQPGPGDPAGLAMRIVLGAVASAAFFWLVWRLGAGLGFGDVRLAPLLGAVTAADGWTAWTTGMLLGTALGAVWGLATAAWRRRHPNQLGSIFPYGPALWLGAWLAILLV